jgi:hypothetical protein
MNNTIAYVRFMVSDEIKCDVSGCDQPAYRIYYVTGTTLYGDAVYLRCRNHRADGVILPFGIGTISEFEVETGMELFSGMIAEEVHKS